MTWELVRSWQAGVSSRAAGTPYLLGQQRGDRCSWTAPCLHSTPLVQGRLGWHHQCLSPTWGWSGDRLGVGSPCPSVSFLGSSLDTCSSGIVCVYTHFGFFCSLGLCCNAQAFSGCGEQGLSLSGSARAFSGCGERGLSLSGRAWAFSGCGEWGATLKLRCAGFFWLWGAGATLEQQCAGFYWAAGL